MSGSEPVVRPDVLRLLERLAADMVRDDLLEDLKRELNSELAAEIPEAVADPGIRRDLDVSTYDLLQTSLASMAKDPLLDVDFPPAAFDFARTLAKRGHDVGLMLRMYRTGQRVFWSRIMVIVSERVDDRRMAMEVLQYLWGRMSRVLERNLDLLVDVHTAERELQLRGVMRRRSETTQALLRGEPLEVDDASVRLGHNLRLTQLGLVLWATDELDEDDPSGRLETLAGELARQLGAGAPLTLQSGVRAMWAWLALTGEPDLGLLDGARSLHRHPGLRVASGVPAPGVAGFRDSHREALRAQAVAAQARGRPRVTRYGDVEVLSLISGDEDAMRALVARELAGLAGPGAGLRRLRETALAYLNTGGSARAAAEELGVHKNTVLYRLRQVDELLGHPIDERRLPLQLALLLTDAYGRRILPGNR